MKLNFFKIFFLLIFYFVFQISSLAQIAPNCYFVGFKDKNNNNFSIDNAEKFLSTKAIERRKKQNIKIDFLDLPVSDIYIDSLKTLGVKILNKSKWLNGSTFYTEDTSVLKKIKNLSFVDTLIISKIKTEIKDSNAKKIFHSERLPNRLKNTESKNNYYKYGKSFTQININNGQFLHNEGFRGENMLIAVTDNGFKGVDIYDAFAKLRFQNRIIASYNFLDSKKSIYSGGNHGTACLSIICGDISNEIIGSAPNANYVLLISEDDSCEEIIEEYNWVSAAEFADSIGADIISVSLGYFNFDSKIFNHNYYELDGKTTVISRAANVAARKGMIVCVAAGNSYSWINAPGDADSILTVAALFPNGYHALFSSVGYSADGRIKPDVAAMGTQVYHQGQNNKIASGAGTSFATPIIAGLTACLWQKFPNKTNMEIIDAIRKSANDYFNPSNTCGYGIADFEIASLILENSQKNDSIICSPDIIENDEINFNFKCNNNDKILIKIKNPQNKVIYNEKIEISNNIINNDEKIINKSINLNNCKSGIYELKIKINKKTHIKKFVKYQ